MLFKHGSIFTSALTLFILFCSHITHAQFDTSALSEQLNRGREKLGKNYVFIMYKDGKVVYKRENAEFNQKTQMPIGATSQWLTAAVVMTFIQEGKISLDDKVSQYLPVFGKYYKGHITIRHCLTNYTGIQADKLLQKSKYHSLEEEVNDYASKKDIQTNAGTEFRYSNIGFNIVGRVLEVISKRTFDRLVMERLTRPLAMKSTTFANEDYNDAINPATGARSSAADLTNFLSMLLSKGSFNGKPVLSESSVETLLGLYETSDKIKNAPAFIQGSNYALGSWIMETSDNGRGTSYTAPSYTGTVPVLDVCRGYGYVVFTKDLSTPPTKDFYINIKASIDEAIPAQCN